MVKWHFYEAEDIVQGDFVREFRDQGALVSLARETIQNSTDNPLDETSPIRVKFTITDAKPSSKYFENEWYSHCLVDKAKIPSIAAHSVRATTHKVLLIEDYNVTGLVGNPLQFKENFLDSGDYDQETRDNVFLWFMRAKGVSRPKGGRGGSWGLGKLSIPFSSKISTFFMVTCRNDGLRYLVGQTHGKRHAYETVAYKGQFDFAANDLLDDSRANSWQPITDDTIIREFNSHYSVTREENMCGTSMIVPIPKDEIILDDLKIAAVSNYLRPIIEGDLILEFCEDGVTTTIDSNNVYDKILNDEFVSNEERQPQRKNGRVNPAWTCTERLKELHHLFSQDKSHQSEGTGIAFNLKSPVEGSSLSSQFSDILPDKNDPEVVKLQEVFEEGSVIHCDIEIPVQYKHKETEWGKLRFLIRKCDDPKSAEAHYYRDQISLKLQNKMEPCFPEVSSLLICDTINECPLGEMLRNAEGPAHLVWNSSEANMDQYELAPSTITFIQKLPGEFANLLLKKESKASDIWSSWFPSGKSEGGKPPNIERFFEVQYTTSGFEISIRPQHVDEVPLNTPFMIRVGYPRPQSQNPKKAPDPRRCDVTSNGYLDWHSNVSVNFDVPALDGSICKDRVSFSFDDRDSVENFELSFTGQDSRLRAMASITGAVQ